MEALRGKRSITAISPKQSPSHRVCEPLLCRDQSRQGERHATRDPDDDQVRDEERKLLNKLRLTAFTATPGTVKPFQLSTLAWDVLVPDNVSSVIDVTFTVGNHNVPAMGNLRVTPLARGRRRDRRDGWTEQVIQL